MNARDNREESSLNSLEQRLYERDTTLSYNKEKRTELRRKSFDVPHKWEDARIENQTTTMAPKKQKSHTWVKWFVIMAGVFFVLALGVAVYMFGGGGNIISTNNVTISVAGPISIPGGDTLTLQIDIENGNTTTLETTDLLIEYPEGTRTADNVTQGLPRVRESLGDIRPGQQVTRTVDAILFGDEGEKQTIAVSVEYRVAGSNAIFVKKRSYEIEISSAPLSLTVTGPEKTTTNNEFQLTIEVTSNATETIEGVLLSAEYPFGFTFNEATPEPVFNNRIWDLGDIKPGGVRTIRLRGVLLGQDNEERVFRFQSGLAEAGDPHVLVTPFTTVIRGMTIARPDISVGLAFNGDTTGEYIGKSNDVIRTDVTWQNNTGERIVDGVIEVVFAGSALNQGTVSATGGFYQSGTNSIVWDKRTVPVLADIPAGGTGRVSFGFASHDFTRETLRDPSIGVTASIRGTIAASEGAEIVQSETKGNVAIASDFLLSGRALYFSGPHQNTGPVPPKVGSETTYTVVWTVTNTVSDVTSAQVRATLPSHMRFVGLPSPSSETLTYNPVGGEVLWNIGTVKKGAGYTLPPREVAFQVALIPSISQVGTSPTLIGGGALTGTDATTRTQVRDTYTSMTTRINADPQFQTGQDKVVE